MKTAICAILARRCASHRQGYCAFSRGLLARFPDVRGLPLPKQIFGHGFLLARGGAENVEICWAMSSIRLSWLSNIGVDQLRYFLLREVSFGQDGSFSAEAIVTRCNAELANSFGNLAQRTLSQIFKNCDGYLPAIHGHTG